MAELEVKISVYFRAEPVQAEKDQEDWDVGFYKCNQEKGHVKTHLLVPD